MSAGVLALVLWGLSGATRQMRTSAKRTQAVALLAALDRGLENYARQAGAYPAGDETGRADAALAVLAAAQRGDAGFVPGVPRALVVRGPRGPSVRDPWGGRLRYVTPAYAADPQRAARNAGRPVLLSAGPDGDFGDHDAARNSDNLASDDQPLPSE